MIKGPGVVSARTESIQHLTGGEPMVRLSSAEGDQGSFAEKNPFLNHCVIAAQPEARQKDRGRP
jgi:hypothetical protein